MPERALTPVAESDDALDSPRAGSVDGRTLFDVALVPLLLGLGGCFWFTAAAAGTSAANALACLAIGSLAALAFARDPFAADRYTRAGIGAIAVLAIYYVLQRPFALSPGGAMLEGCRLATVALVIWAGRAALTRASSRWLLLAGIGAVGAYVSAPTVWDVLRDGAPKARVAGELGYWNASAIVALTLVPLAAALARSPKRWMVPLSGTMVTAAAAVAAATASRGALAATFAGLIVLMAASSDRRRWMGVIAVAAAGLVLGIGVLAWDPVQAWVSLAVTAILTTVGFSVAARRAGPVARDTRAPRPRRMSVLGVVICVAATVLVGALMVNAASTKVELRGDNDDVSRLATTGDSLRFDWWSESVDRWGDARVFGQGGQAFEVARAMRTTVQDPVAHPHSLALQVLVEAGLIGLMVGLAAGLAVLRATLGAPRSPERAVASGVAVMILLQAAIDWTWSLPQVMAIGALALAILLPGRSRDDHPVLDPLPRVSVRTSLATLGIFAGLAVVALIPALAGLLADQSARDIDAGDPASGADFARQSMELVPDFNTLQLEVLALEAQGKTAAARRALEERERVWWPLPSGLQFAQQRYPTDSKQYQRIQRRLERP